MKASAFWVGFSARRSAASLAGIAILVTGLLAPTPARADDDASARVTFTKDILPILQGNCQNCHRPLRVGFAGMVAPMALMTYEEVRPWAKSIAKVVKSGEMPPWSAAEHQRGVFENERFLTDEEKSKIQTWVRTGSPRGNAEDAPPPLVISDKKWWLGEPDLILQLPEPLWVADDVVDWQPMVPIKLTKEMLPEDRWLRGMECVPDSESVHHIVIYPFGKGIKRDRGSGGVGGTIGGLAPGAEPTLSNSGHGYLLTTGMTLAVSMHYHKEAGEGTGSWDQSKIGLFFYPKDAEVLETHIAPIGTMQFEIPAGDPNYELKMSDTFDRPIHLLSMLPHMHFRGKAAKYEATYPDGTTELLLDVPAYDYDWQHSYQFAEEKHLPAGTKIDVTMWFDNSADNPANPDPTRPVGFGLASDDEMAFGWMAYSYDDEEPRTALAPAEIAAPASD